MREMLAALKNEYDAIKNFKITSPKGAIIGDFKDFVTAILESGKTGPGYPYHFYPDYMVKNMIFVLEAKELASDTTVAYEKAMYDLLTAYDQLVEYHRATQKWEMNCRHMHSIQEGEYPGAHIYQYCCYKKDRPKWIGWLIKDRPKFISWTRFECPANCPNFEYNSEMRIQGQDGQVPKTLNELLNEMFSFTVKCLEQA
jgi:hypothetical protein